MDNEDNLEKSQQLGSNTLACPTCNATKSKVIDKRNYKDYIIRRRECINKHRYSTIEGLQGTVAYGAAKLIRPDFAEKFQKILMNNINYQNLAKELFIALK